MSQHIQQVTSTLPQNLSTYSRIRQYEEIILSIQTEVCWQTSLDV